MRQGLPISIALLLTGVFSADHTFANLLGEENLPVVLTPARLKQNRTEVPASVSVIDRDMIIASGLREIPELFRLIPGTSVGARDGWNHVVSYHGTNYRDSRRMQVLIDGRSVYQAGLATVDWSDIPITIEDIERIEVVRGPSTAAYGANAFLGVINIITRHPADRDRLNINVKVGDQDTEDYRVSHAGDYAGGFYGVTVASRRDSGFDHKMDGSERRDGKNLELINTRYERQLSSGISSSFAFGYKQGWTEDDRTDLDVTPPDNYVRDYYFSGKLEWEYSVFHTQSLRLDHSSQDQETEWTVALPPQFIGIFTNPNPIVMADANQNIRVSRQDLDFQDTYIWSKSFQTVSGIHLKKARAQSETYYGGTIDNHSYQLFANAELKLNDYISANAGGSYEYEQYVGKNFSPRYSLHFHINADHGFRMIYSEAIRSPDLLETSADWQYTARNVRPAPDGQTEGTFALTATGNPDVRPERIESREIGYYGNFRQYHLQWDVKIFDDKLDRLISKSIALDSFDPSNDTSLSQKGAETEVDFRPNHHWLFHLSYAYIEAEASSKREEEFTPQSAGSVLVSYRFDSGLQVSAAHYYAREIGTDDNKFSRSDVRIAQSFNIGNSRLEIAFTAQYRQDNDSELLADNRYHDDFRQWISVNLHY
ncbi:TonB-dependent receptor [Spongiibacter taiwanensis]|uniref:TonB-dependent receptor plug domain-containing protein n=1 Tax=Spongiibacter taiwanensis TaxID=1748242 RepID=UPI002034DCC7|nr:TonB-dependent receptor [Spongiibacter taiwanensis]USA41805.1 TonB-dependent receptor [Spongiibacter taiwanensis]